MHGCCAQWKPLFTRISARCGGVLLIELEGMTKSWKSSSRGGSLCLKQNGREVRRAKNEQERQLLWLGRKTAFGAIGRVSSSYYTQDV